MRSNSEFRDIIHLMSPDLYFCRETEHSEYRRVDTLISIEFRDGDIIFDLLNQRRIIFVDNSKHHIAIAHCIGDHPVSKQIHNIADLCRLISLLEFLKHSIRAFDPSFYLEILYSFFMEKIRQDLDASFGIFFSFTEIFF